MTASPPPLPSAPVRVLLGDSRAWFRTGLVALLAARPPLLVVAQAPDAAELLRLAPGLIPDVVVIDIHLSGGALEVAHRLQTLCPSSRILLYGISSGEAVVTAGLQVGVTGFVDDHADVDELATAIGRVAAGEPQISPRLVPQITVQGEPMVSPLRATARVSLPTQRELEVLRLIASGFSNREAASVLRVSQHTVRAHLRSISHKLGVRNRIQAVTEALRAGLIAGGPADASSD